MNKLDFFELYLRNDFMNENFVKGIFFCLFISNYYFILVVCFDLFLCVCIIYLEMVKDMF